MAVDIDGWVLNRHRAASHIGNVVRAVDDGALDNLAGDWTISDGVDFGFPSLRRFDTRDLRLRFACSLDRADGRRLHEGLRLDEFALYCRTLSCRHFVTRQALRDGLLGCRERAFKVAGEGFVLLGEIGAQLAYPRRADELPDTVQTAADHGPQPASDCGACGVIALLDAGFVIEELYDRIDRGLDRALLECGFDGAAEPARALGADAEKAFGTERAAGKRAAERGCRFERGAPRAQHVVAGEVGDDALVLLAHLRVFALQFR